MRAPTSIPLPTDLSDADEWCEKMRAIAYHQVLRAITCARSFSTEGGVLVLHGADARWDAAIHPFNKKINNRSLAALIADEAQVSLDATLTELDKIAKQRESMDDLNKMLNCLHPGWKFSEAVVNGPLEEFIAKVPKLRLLSLLGVSKADTLADTQANFVTECWREIFAMRLTRSK